MECTNPKCSNAHLAGISAALASAVFAAAGTVQQATPGPWGSLHRPLRLPTVALDGRCPVSAVGRVNFAKYGVGKGIGQGPAYPIGFAQPGSWLKFGYPPRRGGRSAGSQWGGAKVVWFIAPIYRGPVLIRGRHLDTGQPLRFNGGKVPPTEMRIASRAGSPANGVRYRLRRTFTRLRGPGCYAYQIDGTTFSRVVVCQGLQILQ
jgi:hypothetical protein